MITLQTITGLLIAAVLNVLGTGQHEVAKVENEPVVKEGVTALDNVWYVYDGDPIDLEDGNYESDILDATKYTRFSADPNQSPNCLGSNQICSVRLPDNGSQPDQGDLNGMASDITGHTASPDLQLKP